MKLNKLLIIGFSSILLSSVVSAEDKDKDKKGPKTPKRSFDTVDTDKDGKISEAEFITGAIAEDKAKARFKKKDKNADGFLNKEEFAKGKCKKKGPKKPKKDKPKKEKDPE